MRNLQEQVKNHSVTKNCSDLKKFANYWLLASNFKSFSRSLKQFFLTFSQNNFGNKIPFLFNITKKILPFKLFLDIIAL